MRHRAGLGFLALTLVSSCVTTTTLKHQRASVRSLKVIGLDQQETKDVVVLLDPITANNWRDQADAFTDILFESNNLTTMPIAIGSNGSPTALSTGREPIEDRLPIVPLPAFRITVINRGTQPVTIDPSQWTISDGNGPVGRLFDDEAFRREVERVIWQRHRNLYEAAEQELLTSLRQTLSQLSLVGHGRAIAPGDHWQGLISFDFYTNQPIRELHVTIDGTHVGEQPDAALEFRFASERRAKRACDDGRAPSALGVCRGDSEAFDPAPAGPCIQETRSSFSAMRKQIWIASAPVADSDLYATLQSAPPSRQLVNRGLKLRLVGWVLVGVGIFGAVATTVGLLRSDARADAGAGASVLSLSGVGLGLAFKGHALIRDGMNRYNEMAESSGVCSTVY